MSKRSDHLVGKTVDLWKEQDDSWAVHLPAISAFFAREMAKLDDNDDHYGKGRWSELFETGHKGLDFLKQDAYFHYSRGLYSAGHAKLDIEKGKVSDRMVQGRDRENTILVGDSGGFQIAKGTGPFKNVDWEKFKTPAGDKIRADILNWLEETSDYAMTLDIPAFAAMPPLNKKTGLNTFEETLDLTLYNLNYFMTHRTPGKTKFLNVLSGSSFENAGQWYKAVKAYSDPAKCEEMGYGADKALEGYAFAGFNMRHMPSVLTRLTDLIEDGLLEGKEWIHFLGIGRIDWGCYLTQIQRQLRKHYNPTITLSFDCASPFIAIANGQMYSHPTFSNKRFGYNMKPAVDSREFTDEQLDLNLPFNSPIADRMTIRDICKYKPGEPNKFGNVAKTSWDSGSYLLMMAHNVYTHIYSVQEANRLMDYELARHTIHYSDWTKEKKNSQANEVSDFVPANVLFFASFVEELFEPGKTAKERKEMIANNVNFLEAISFAYKQANTFNSFFGGSSQNPEDDYASYESSDDDFMIDEDDD